MRRIATYIHQLTKWPDFHWEEKEVANLLAVVFISLCK
ncbi:DUF4172 domain-containing protein [Parafilimonas sp.]